MAGEDASQGKQDSAQEQEVQQRSSPSGKVVYKAILKEADAELERPTAALAWSGLAAGMSMGFSFVAEALLHAHLPDKPWRPLISKLGYSVGFVVVILGRQQLFTENTLTPVLPLLLRKDAKTFVNMMRLWAVVLAANLLGALIMAWAITRTDVFPSHVHDAFRELGHAAMSHDFGNTLLKGIFAGWLIALIVWLLPFAEAARFFVIVLLTYVVGLANFSHIVAGAVEVFSVAWAGQKPWTQVLGYYLVPTLIGNTLGGVTLVAALNHAQVVAGGEGEDV
jgi:formate/nitrite transporter FocA (FNT family)